MKDLSLFNDIPNLSMDYIKSLQVDENFNFLPTKRWIHKNWKKNKHGLQLLCN